MKLDFHKYHGTGNDFILIDNRNAFFEPEKDMIARLCDRRFGIGADGLILLNNKERFDFSMEYYNADGGESTMCGNGGRCIIAFADFLSHTSGNARFLGPDGEHTGIILHRDRDQYLVKLSLRDVPFVGVRGKDFVIDTGSPHLVRFVADVASTDVVHEGRELRNNVDFSPGGINVNFVQEHDRKLIVRTYERGVEDETLSCGTGVTASALAFAASRNLKDGIIEIITKGGNLSLHFQQKNEAFTGIFLEGPAVRVFHGNVEI